MKNKKFALAVAVGVSCGSGASAWEIQPSVTGQLTYDDNARLSETNEVSTFGQGISPVFKLSNDSEVTRFSINSRFEFWNYNEEELSRQDQFFDLRSSRRSEKQSIGLDLSHHRTSTTVTELEDSGQLLQVADRVISSSIAPSWQYQFSYRQLIDVSYRGATIEYRSIDAGLTDYVTHTLAAAYQYSLSETDSVSLTTQFQMFEYDDVVSVIVDDVGIVIGAQSFGSSSDTLSLYAGYVRQFSETLSSSLYLGVQQSEYEFLLRQGPVSQINEGDDGGGYIAVNITSTDELNRYTVDFSRSVSPSSSSVSFNQDRLRVAARRRFAETFSGTLSLVLVKREALDREFSFDDRDYMELSPGLSWRLSRALALDTRYRYRRQKYGRSGSDWAESNALVMSVRYIGQSSSW